MPPYPDNVRQDKIDNALTKLSDKQLSLQHELLEMAAEALACFEQAEEELNPLLNKQARRKGQKLTREFWKFLNRAAEG